MKKVIVSGANGFVGSALVRDLVNNGIRVIALDLENHDNHLPKSHLVEFIPFELSKSEELVNKIEERGFDAFFILLGLVPQARREQMLNFN